MSEVQKCDGISSDSIPNTSQEEQTSPPQESDKSGKKKQPKPSAIASGAGGTPAKYQPFDLKSLIFKPIASEQTVNIWYATPAEFHAYVQQFVQRFSNVNTAIWPLADRLALVNTVWDYCQQHGNPFPFERQHLVPDVDGGDVPDVHASGE